MELKGKQVLVCNCEVSMALDGARLAEACGADGGCQVHTQLCRAQIQSYERALAAGTPLLVGCTQEAPLFEERRAELAPDRAVAYVNLRERAGWAEEGPEALPKMAALLAEAALEVPATPSVTLTSAGRCLVHGDGQVALDAARQLAPRLAVTLLLRHAEGVIPPARADLPILAGRIAKARGHLGAFEVEIAARAVAEVSARRALTFAPAGGSAASSFDLILDLSGEAPLFPGQRDGYFRPDPGHPAAVQRALFDLTDLVGEFEKPRYVRFDPGLCAHARSQRVGCTRCLDACPASAITPDGDVVRIDPGICGGCGACHSVCPTGAASYDYPPAGALLERLRTLLGAYRKAGGRQPVLLVHDQDHGSELIGLSARLGRGLPARVLPFAVNEVTQLGLDAIFTTFAYGAERLLVLVPPKRAAELAGLEAQQSYAEAALAGLGYGAGRIELLVEADPEAVEAHLHALAPLPTPAAGGFLSLGDKRSVMRQALQELHRVAPAPVDQVALPVGAPFGRVVVEADGCTLCLACVGACPTGAMVDNPERPELRFTEDACVQCGLCVSTCPERVITLEPRLNFTDAARQPQPIKAEEPFECVRCGKPFGTRSSIEKIVAMLAERHAMFQDSGAIDRIRMCEDCRVIVQFEATDNPLAGPPKPAVRTTDDDLREREEIEAARREHRDQRAEDDDTA